MIKNNYENFKVEIILVLFTFAVILSFILTNKVLFGEKIKGIAVSNSINIYYEKQKIFEEFLDLSRNKLNSINNSNSFNDFLKSNDEEKIKDLFLALARTSVDIMQLRYIDKNGNEIIRLDRDKIASEVHFVEKEQLQNKKDRDYFYNSINKAQKVWFSNLDLNIENKKVQIPFNPTLRAILPLKKDSSFNGIVIINYFMEDFLKIFEESAIYNTILFDKNGNTLSHYEKEKSWGFYLDKKYNLNSEYKEEIQKALIYNKYEDENTFIKKFDFDISNELYILIELKEEYLKQLDNQELKENVIVSFIVFIFALISSMFLSKLFRGLTKTIVTTSDRLNDASLLVKLAYYKYSFKTNMITFDDNIFNLLNYKDIKKKSYYLEELDDFFDDEFLDKIKFKIKNIQNEDFFEFHNLDKNNKKLTFFTKFRAISKNDKIIELEGILQDITEEKILLKSFEKAKNDAENANEAKSKFLATMSHEIRTPLNGIIGLTKLALESNPNDKIKDFLTKSDISSSALLNVINDILDYSKIEANKLTFEKKSFEFDKLLLNVTNLFDYQAYQKQISLHINHDHRIPKILLGDHHRITQILNNLVGNAVKFTQRGQIEIKTSLIKKDEKLLVLKCSVEDSGIGISKEDQDKLFKSFSQVDDSTTRVYGGTGLGLSITKELVELMNGKIEVSSVKGLGTTFSFTFELEYENNFNFDNKHLKNKKFMIVDDNEIDIRLLENILNSWKVKSYSFLNSNDALKKLNEENDFDYILVDWIMDDIDGVNFVKQLKEKNSETSPKIIMVTAFEEDNLKAKLKEEKVKINNILRKPFTPSTIYNTIINFEETKKTNYLNNQKLEEKIIINAKVLLVEDNEINQMICQEMLKRMGLKVIVANDGIEAIKMCKENNPDIVLMDLHMPRMNGFNSSKAIREFNKDVPIIALTSAVMDEDKIAARKAGMQEHLSKPIDFDELLNTISSYLPNLITKEKKQSNEIHNLDKYVDRNELLNRVGSEELANQLLEKFALTYKDYGKELTNDFKNQDKLSKEIHKLKGVSGNLALKVLYKQCIKIEEELNLEKKEKLLNELIVELENITKLIYKKNKI
ncbi:hypothetical protein LPB137_03745 [Poseidonibacter parvus]|uniref:histidine kinase n=1 Tax=Poseidonibacter parvus TaxID=1850254 RepID=A0A1P8KKD6_9BACT|nr:response regulator [Poseidonibacter parvus]APW65010.1 hypothetical protein LPB137_03745 [Poseidonibacter parvus]